MVESHLNQIAAPVPATNPGIPSQPEGLESVNLIDMFNAGNYWSNPVVEVHNDLLPVKRGDPGRPVIPISIGMVDFLEEDKRRNRNKKQVWTESAKMVTAIHRGQDHRLKLPFLIKKDDPGVPSIKCSINGYSFQKTLCDTGSGVNIMAAVIYQHLYRTTVYAIQRTPG